MTEEVFQGRVIFGAPAAGGGGSLARFQMVGIHDQQVPSGESVICEFEDPEDETEPRQMDPYSLRSTTTLDGGGGFGDIAIGDAIVMTAELAGTWQISVLRKMLSAVFWDVSGIYMSTHGGFLNRNAAVQQYGNVQDSWEMGNFADPAQGYHRLTSLSATHLIDLAEGDYLWADANAATSDASDTTLEKIVLTGVRVGPVVVPGS